MGAYGQEEGKTQKCIGPIQPIGRRGGGKSHQNHLGKKSQPPTEQNKTKREGYILSAPTTKTMDEKQRWDIYNTIRGVESTFRCLKTDLNIRPVYHQSVLFIIKKMNVLSLTSISPS
ncbi:MAG: hypothetical protein AAF620_10900 [Bacteroidota bacterium]